MDKFGLIVALFLFQAVAHATDKASVESVSVDSTASQAEALLRYPELGKAGSPFNNGFLERVTQWRKDCPKLFSIAGWPMLIANSVADDLVEDSKDLVKVEDTPDPQAGAAAAASARRIFVVNSAVARVLDVEFRVVYDDATSETKSVRFTPRRMQEFSFHTTKRSIMKVEILSVKAGDLMPP